MREIEGERVVVGVGQEIGGMRSFESRSSGSAVCRTVCGLDEAIPRCSRSGGRPMAGYSVLLPR